MDIVWRCKNIMSNHHKTITSLFLIPGIFLIAANLRPGLTAVGPLIGFIRDDMNLSNGLAGLLTTLPLIAFAVCSPLAPKIAKRYGLERAIFAGIIILMIGFLIRMMPVVSTLFIGTAFIGLGVAIGNVLLPGLIKQRFATKVGLMTGAYSTAMGFCASLASGLSIPLAKGLHFGWREALACWVILTVIGALIWIPQLYTKHKPVRMREAGTSFRQLFRSPLAWQVTLFMGLQSFSFYVVITWLPELLHDGGMGVSVAGWMLSLCQFIGLPFTFFVPMVADRLADQRGIVMGIVICYLVGVIGLLFGGGPVLLVIWTLLVGIALGASISLSLTFLGMRAANAQQAAALSGMAQSIGYLLAAVGPALFGFLRDLTHSWTLPLLALIVIGVMMLISGLGAGRNQYIIPDKEAFKNDYKKVSRP